MTLLLPENATDAERAFEAVAAARIEAIAAPARLMWDPWRCPSDFLPWLAWALSVDDWDNAWSDAQKREMVAGSIEVHRHKGTLGGMRRALRLAGYGDAVITEGEEGPRLGKGGWTLGRTIRLGKDDGAWADYRVTVQVPVTQKAADRLAAYLQSVAPVRSKLRAIRLEAGKRHVLGRGVWRLGREITLGGVYFYEVT